MLSHSIIKKKPLLGYTAAFYPDPNKTEVAWDEAVRRCQYQVGDFIVYDPTRSLTTCTYRQVHKILEIQKDFSKGTWPSYNPKPPILHLMSLGGFMSGAPTQAQAFSRWAEDDPAYRRLTASEMVVLQDDQLQNYIKEHSARILGP